ncbi:MAG TPA: hypothetical protein VFI27_16130 [candidate division Zixibacteria bacterium]|nr:hypothetical protein [candidate division Zixibacteria bacterium]
MFWIRTGENYQTKTNQDFGQAPFWINDDTFGYVRLEGGTRWEVVFATLGQDSRETAFEPSDLEAQLPEEQRLTRLSIALVEPAGSSGE